MPAIANLAVAFWRVRPNKLVVAIADDGLCIQIPLWPPSRSALIARARARLVPRRDGEHQLPAVDSGDRVGFPTKAR